ncbi:MAG: DUF692 domain-containing protein, partial [Candidatus Caenarcaniphilales bacterium]|nr:DUF692 domain-containing protein [Candidatus Caenarcaniphilales bacterium]
LISHFKKLFQKIKAPWFSDHLSCTRIQGYYLQDLIPIPRTKEAVDIVCDNIKFLQDQFQIPFLIENPSYYSLVSEPELSEADFINQILYKADCGLLLDVNNIYVNSANHQSYSPKEFLYQIDLSRLVQVHIAGHLKNYKAKLSSKSLAILDTHGDKISEDVLNILQELLRLAKPKAILLERDSNFPDFDELLEELEILNTMNYELA